MSDIVRVIVSRIDGVFMHTDMDATVAFTESEWSLVYEVAIHVRLRDVAMHHEKEVYA